MCVCLCVCVNLKFKYVEKGERGKDKTKKIHSQNIQR